MTSKTKSLPLFAGLFLVSCSILHLEILQTRIFSVMLWHHVTYLVVTFTLLGFAAAGAFVAIRPSMLKGDLPLKLARFTALYGLTTVAAFTILSHFQLDTVNLLKNKIQYFLLFVYYIYLIVPYFFGGLVIVMLLSGMAKEVNRFYFVNLAGSGVGCLFFIPVIKLAGGAGSVMVVVLTAFLSALCFALAGSKRCAVFLASSAVLIVITAVAIPFADGLIDIKPAPSKAMSVVLDEVGGTIEHTRWDPLCRVDVVVDPETGVHGIYQDGDAPTTIMQWQKGASLPIDHYSLGYLSVDKPRVLIIGVGGGLDIRQALFFKAESVTGAEINPTIDRLLREDYGEFTGNLYEREKVKIEVAEGRSFLRRSEAQYDLIQMTGTDTYSALSSGSFILSESYLYTKEAFDDYLDHLSDDGLIAVLRFRFYPPRECLRLVSIGAEAMKRRGIEDPGRHIIVVSYDRPPQEIEGRMVTFSYAVMLFKKTPFTEKQITRYRQFCDRENVIGKYALSHAPGLDGEKEFTDLLAAVGRGEEADFYDSSAYDITPVSDDRPFFFAYHKWRSVFDRITSPDYQGVIGQDPVGLYILLSVLIEATLLVALLVLLPLLVFKRKGLKIPGGGRVFFYFFVLGVSYLFIEIGAMQKFVLFLGHPTYSLSIVLFTFLLFSGFGSLFSGRFNHAPLFGTCLAVLSIAILLILYQFLLPAVFSHALSFPTIWRMVISVILLAPVAFLMGMPFPLGIRVVDQRSPDLIPWAFGINGGASVISSVVSIVIAMAGGFTAVFLLAGIMYILGWIYFRKFAAPAV